MRLLFEIDKKDYKENGTVGVRPSVRGIIVRDNKIGMIHSLKYDYYKFPGGGAEGGENHRQTLIREVKEESGLVVIPDSIREYGYVHRVQKGKYEDIFIQDNYYYFCEVYDEITEQNLDDYEEEEKFVLEFVTPQQAIDININHAHGDKSGISQFEVMLERELQVLEMLMKENRIYHCPLPARDRCLYPSAKIFFRQEWI